MHFVLSEKSPKIPIFSTFINNENLQNFEEKKSWLGTWNFRIYLYLRKVQHYKKSSKHEQLKSNPLREVNAKFIFDVFS